MRPDAQGIAVPPFPRGVDWIGGEPAAVERICAQGPLLVHFVDVAHASSVRTLPYLNEWVARYGDLGLSVVGVNSPRFPFTADPRKLEAALSRLRVTFPVAVDSRYELWHAYGCEGWPSLFLWGRGGALRWFHFGEGEYSGTEDAIREELGQGRAAGADLPEPLAPLRPSDAPGALVAVPSEEVLPGGSIEDPWTASDHDSRLELDYSAGESWASVDGRGSLEVSLDGGPGVTVAVDAPGAYRLTIHPHHSSHHLTLRASPGLRVYCVGYAAGVPASTEAG
jgi:hypothetical protein